MQHFKPLDKRSTFIKIPSENFKTEDVIPLNYIVLQPFCSIETRFQHGMKLKVIIFTLHFKFIRREKHPCKRVIKQILPLLKFHFFINLLKKWPRFN